MTMGQSSMVAVEAGKSRAHGSSVGSKGPKAEMSIRNFKGVPAHPRAMEHKGVANVQERAEMWGDELRRDESTSKARGAVVSALTTLKSSVQDGMTNDRLKVDEQLAGPSRRIRSRLTSGHGHRS